MIQKGNVIGVAKAYTTHVGGGPFATEETGDVGHKLQEIGKEIKVSTGRTRRCGWLDLVVLRYSAAVNHETLLTSELADFTTINLTKREYIVFYRDGLEAKSNIVDVLDTFATIRVAVAYVTPDGEKLMIFPADLILLEKCTVEYVDFQGWQSSTKRVRRWSDLPPQAQEYIKFIESSIGAPVVYIGTGPDREDMVVRE